MYRTTNALLLAAAVLASCGGGGSGSSDPVVVAADATAPTVTITAPAAGVPLTGSVRLAADVTDAGGVANLTSSHPNGGVFPVGTTGVTIAASRVLAVYRAGTPRPRTGGVQTSVGATFGFDG